MGQHSKTTKTFGTQVALLLALGLTLCLTLGLAPAATAATATASVAPTATSVGSQQYAVSAAARHSSRGKCVTKAERKKVKTGMKRRRAEKILDGKGSLHRKMGNYAVQRKYRACSSSYDGYMVLYGKRNGRWVVNTGYFY